MVYKVIGSSWHTMWYFFILILQILILVKSDDNWGKNCPSSCTCHISVFKDLPLTEFIREKTMKNENQTSPPHKNVLMGNEAFYEEDENPSATDFDNSLLKMVMCVLASDLATLEVFNAIPSDVQVLSILQGSSSGDINIDFKHMQNFQDLVVLEINGYQQNYENNLKNKPKQISNGKIILHDDALKPLISLQYVNLQCVKLLGSVKSSENEIPKLPEDINYESYSSNIIVPFRNDKRGRQNVRSTKTKNVLHLTFLTPDLAENKILPYKEYKQEQEKAGLSIFAGLDKLLFLRVVNCGLQKVSWEMFQGLEMLQYLFLEKNNLLFLPEFAFYGTPNLKILSLAQNNLLNLQSTALAGLLELEHLDLSHNNFSHLSELSLPPFPKLLIANFKHNPIESVFASTFEIMNATTTLFIGGKESALDIQPNSFSGLQALQKLSLFNIRVPIMERELLYGMANLRELEMTGKINALSYDSFLEVSKLEKLALKRCNIKTISMDAFYGLYSLLYLDLSNNIIDTLPPGVFDQQFSLRELLLQNNNLTELPTGFFKNVPAKMIRLEGNPWHCSCSMRDWQPSVTNKVKKSLKKVCQTQYYKGSLCTTSDSDEYVYEKSVAPRCKTPKKYKNWSVYHTLRKQLQCLKKVSNKISRKAYLQKKQDFENSLKFKYYDKKFNYNSNFKNKINNLESLNNSRALDQNSTDNNTITNSIHLNSAVDIKILNAINPPLSGTENTISPVNNKGLQKMSKSVESTFQNNQSANNYNESVLQQNVVNDEHNISSQNISERIRHSKIKYDSKSKKEREKIELLNKKLGKTFPAEPKRDLNVSLNANNSKVLSKQAWKLEMERKHKEKLRKYQLLLNETIHF